MGREEASISVSLKHSLCSIRTTPQTIALAYARQHGYPLLLLDGIPKFYHRYGFCDVYDLSTQEMDRQAIQALSASPYAVRQARPEDAASLLALYERQFGSYTGSFARSLEHQMHWMRHIDPEKLFVAGDRANLATPLSPVFCSKTGMNCPLAW